VARALVTGATGFIGGHLVRVLAAAGWDVHAVVRNGAAPEPAESHRVDGSQERLTAILAAVRPDVVFHLASLFLADHTPDQVVPLASANIVFSMQLAEAMARTECRRLVSTGTAWQFAADGSRKPVNLYAATKQAFEAILPYYHEVHGLSVVTLWLFDTYGPADPRRKLIRILIEAAQSGKTLDMSPGAQVVDLTHVDDVVAAFVQAAGRLVGTDASLYEGWFVSGERQDIRTLVTKVGEALGQPPPVNFGGRPYRSREVMMPVDPVGQTLPGWKPKRSLAEALPALAQD
jgi:nucleoside-diphosphate-sugar epimerase